MALLAVVATLLMGTGWAPETLAQGHKAGPRQGQFQPGNAHRERVRDERVGPPNGPGGGRALSPEERQRLRRDIRDAGRDVYGPGK